MDGGSKTGPRGRLFILVYDGENKNRLIYHVLGNFVVSAASHAQKARLGMLLREDMYVLLVKLDFNMTCILPLALHHSGPPMVTIPAGQT